MNVQELLDVLQDQDPETEVKIQIGAIGPAEIDGTETVVADDENGDVLILSYQF